MSMQLTDRDIAALTHIAASADWLYSAGLWDSDRDAVKDDVVEALAAEVQHLGQMVDLAGDGQVLLRGLLRDAYPLLPPSPQRDAIHDLLALAEELP